MSSIVEPAQTIGVATLPDLTSIFSGDSTFIKMTLLADSQASPFRVAIVTLLKWVLETMLEGG